MFGRSSKASNTASVSVLYLGLLFVTQCSADKSYRSLLADADKSLQFSPAGVATSRSIPTDDHVTIINNTTTTSVGVLKGCLKKKTTGTNVRFQKVKVPGARGKGAREFTRSLINYYFLQTHSTEAKIFASDFATCARIASIKGMTAFSFVGSNCTGYVMTKFPCPCTAGEFVVYLDLGINLNVTSYYETADYMFYTTKRPGFDYASDKVNLTFAVAQLEEESSLEGEDYAALCYNEGIDLLPMYIIAAYYDIAGAPEECTGLTVVMPQSYKQYKAQYFDELCGKTADIPPIVQEGSYPGEELGPKVIYSHKGVPFIALQNISSVCEVTLPASNNGTTLKVVVVVTYLNGSPEYVCTEGDRVMMATSNKTVMLCGSYYDNALSSRTGDIVVTFTRDPTYSTRQSLGFRLRYGYND